MAGSLCGTPRHVEGWLSGFAVPYSSSSASRRSSSLVPETNAPRPSSQGSSDCSRECSAHSGARVQGGRRRSLLSLPFSITYSSGFRFFQPSRLKPAEICSEISATRSVAATKKHATYAIFRAVERSNRGGTFLFRIRCAEGRAHCRCAGCFGAMIPQAVRENYPWLAVGKNFNRWKRRFSDPEKILRIQCFPIF